MTAKIEGPPPASLTPVGPIPEPSFKWRRLLTYGAFVANTLLIAAALGLIGYFGIEAAKGNDAALVAMARSLMWLGLAATALNALLATLYMAGASASDLARIASSASILKNNVSVRTEQAVSTPAGSATTSTTASQKDEE